MAARRPALRPPQPSARGLARLADNLGNLTVQVVLFVVVIVGAGVLLAASLAPGASLALGVVGTVDDQLLDFPPLPDDLGEPPERSVILARDGSVLAVLHDAENRKIVPLREVPEHVQLAVLATEDADFRRHSGVNWRAVARAAFGNVRAGEITGGGSTITQQLVKNVVVGSEQTFNRKLMEAVYAQQLEQRLTKDEILEAYLNETYFGNGAYGIGTAAEFYFSKHVSELDVSEAALLAAVIRSPGRNDPVRNPEAALERRNIVLGQMVREGWLEQAEAARLQAADLGLVINPLPAPAEPFFVDYVRHLLKQDPALGEDRAIRDAAVLRGGLTIHTTLDPRLQDIAQEVIAEVLTDPDDPLAALAAVDPRTGEVLALAIGPKAYGDEPGQTKVNPAVGGLGGSGRQAGSAFKPFQIVAALEEGISPGYTIDTPSPYRPESAPCKTGGWAPGNYSDAGGGIMDMATATARSSNVYFAHLVDQVTGPEKLAETATRMGIVNTPMAPVCSATLGALDVFPLDMASAFGTLANEGERCAPFAVSHVVDRRDRTISRSDQDCTRAVDAGIAARTTALLRGPIDSGTASRNGRIGRPAAGKTGTTQNHRDAWFVGYIPQLSAAVWTGHEQPAPMRHAACGGPVTGGCLPTMIWQRFMTRAIDALGLPVESFPTPPPLPTGTVPDVVDRTVDEAEEILAEADFVPVTETVTHHAPAGTVVAQRPPGGTRTELGSAITLEVSDGDGEAPTMPDVVGMDPDEARELLEGLGLEVGIQDRPVEAIEQYGYVVDQRPAPGAELDDDASATLYVGRASSSGDDERPSSRPTPSPSPSPSPSPAPAPEPEPSPTASPSPEPTSPPEEDQAHRRGRSDPGRPES